VQSLRSGENQAAAIALQRSLVPSALPAVRGAEIAARYVPGSGRVGGDWYDVLGLPSGALGLVVGDVAGSGLSAAVIMGRMRSALRAYALKFPGPAEVLGKLDRKMQYFEQGDVMATVSYAVLDPDSGPGSCAYPRRATSRRLSRRRTSAVRWPRSPSTRRSASPAAAADRSPHWLWCPAPCCACSPTGWWNAGTSR